MRSSISLVIAISLVGTVGLPQESFIPESDKVEIEKATHERDSTLSKIEAMTAERRCESKSDCRWLPLGQLACGGPRTYAVYSHDPIRTRQLKRLSERHMAAEADLNRLLGIISICPFIGPPEIDCVADLCEIVARSSFDSG